MDETSAGVGYTDGREDEGVDWRRRDELRPQLADVGKGFGV